MPEGDTVSRAAARLSAALAGHPLVRSDFRVPHLATLDLRGRVVLDVVPRGKHLLTRVEGGLTIHTHFRMDGSFPLFRTGAAWRGGPDWQIRLVLANDTWTAVGYRLPIVEVIPTAREQHVVGHLGPDILGPDWDLDTASARMLSDPARPVGEALLDQRNIAGVGNLYRTEALFRSGVSPWTAVGEVPDLPGLLEIARRLMLANRDGVAQRTGALRRGQARYVFDRRGRPCRRCGTPIQMAAQHMSAGARRTYWCPHCQPAPSGRSSPILVSTDG